MDDQTLKSFLAGLQSGLGLTVSAKLVGFTPKAITNYLKENPEVYREAQEKVQYGAKAVMVMNNENLSKRKLTKFQENNRYLKNYTTELVLWEHLSKAADVTPKTIVEGFDLYKERQEVATSVGMTEAELISYIKSDDKLERYLEKSGYL
jgi:predicted transcriptional regulator